MSKTSLYILLIILFISILAAAIYIYANLLKVEDIEVEDAKYILIPNGGGIYMKISNNLDYEICLVGADILDVEGEKVMIHQTISEGNVDRMVMVDKLCIPAKSSVKLERGGYHIMFMNADLRDYEKIKVKLFFDNGEEVVVEAYKL